MTDKHQSNDDIQSISVKLQSITTADANLSSQDSTRTNQTMPKVNNTTPVSNLEERTVSAVEESAMIKPGLNVPEKIVLVIDTVKEHDCTKFKLGTGAKYPPLFMIKRVVEIFVGTKSTIHRKHEFALMTLDSQSVHWLCDFTNNTKTLLNHLDSVEEDVLDEEHKECDLGGVFECIYERTGLLQIPNNNSAVPKFVLRVILIYSRSHCMPVITSGQKELIELLEHPYCFLDTLFVHEPPSPENKCEKIYAKLGEFDVKNRSYILEAGRNATKLHDNMAKLMAHPLQRPVQGDASYTIFANVPSQEVHTNV
ncbi:BRISC and BRCA1-A complex member 1-like [Orussus abietinus]|uniref:BRISC and BRCA1-A complex member 1-like n=1 Tax=Orussus abietinus TaxID=222816 RepID=UPI000625F1B1|nr:BRISC and BRCA1-A complex member 1-like [Orussus abietinus]XP_012286282.1 BRISC and BRCA1-A complex member 1-like [Orussus abietinus]